MKGKLKKAICVALSVTMMVSLTACFGKGGKENSSDALAQASDSANAKEAVFKEIGKMDPETDWFENVLVDGEDVIVVWSEYVDIFGEEGGEIMPGGEPVPYEEDATVVNPSTEEQGIIADDDVAEEIVEDNAEEGVVQEELGTEDVIINDPMMPEVEYIPEDNYSFYYKLNFGKTSFGGTGMSVMTIDLPEKEYSCGISIDPNNGNYIIVTEYTEEDYSDPENYVYKTKFYMNVYTKSG